MRFLSYILYFVLFCVFTGISLSAIIGIYEIAMKFGSATITLIAPTIFMLVSGVLGIVSIYNDIKNGEFK